MCGALALAPPALLTTRRSRCRRGAAASSQRERRPLRHGSPLRLAAVLVHVYVYVHVRTVRLYRVMPRRCGASPLHSLSTRMRCVCGRSACLHVSHVAGAALGLLRRAARRSGGPVRSPDYASADAPACSPPSCRPRPGAWRTRLLSLPPPLSLPAHAADPTAYASAAARRRARSRAAAAALVAGAALACARGHVARLNSRHITPLCTQRSALLLTCAPSAHRTAGLCFWRSSS